MKYLKLLLIVPFFIGLLVTVQNINVKDNANELSLTLQNIEALASGESGNNKTRCFSKIRPLAGSKVTYCDDCKSYNDYIGGDNSSSYSCP